MTLDEFIQKHQDDKLIWPNAWVNCDGFSGMYVRVNERSINGEMLKIIDLANIKAKEPGKGTFRRLISHLTKSWPEYTIHVESVLSERFKDGLIRMGFKNTTIPNNFYLPKLKLEHK